MEKQKPSAVIESFIVFLEQASIEHDDCVKVVDLCGKRNIDYLHDIEFAKDKGASFFKDKCNKPFIQALKRLLKEQKDKEQYLESEKEYTRRAGDEP